MKIKMSSVNADYATLNTLHPKEVQRLIKLIRGGNTKNKNSQPETWEWGYTWNRLNTIVSHEALLLPSDDRLKMLQPLEGLSIYTTVPGGHVQRFLLLPLELVNDPPTIVKTWYKSLFDIERAEAFNNVKNNQSPYKEKGEE